MAHWMFHSGREPLLRIALQRCAPLAMRPQALSAQEAQCASTSYRQTRTNVFASLGLPAFHLAVFTWSLRRQRPSHSCTRDRRSLSLRPGLRSSDIQPRLTRRGFRLSGSCASAHAANAAIAIRSIPPMPLLLVLILLSIRALREIREGDVLMLRPSPDPHNSYRQSVHSGGHRWPIRADFRHTSAVPRRPACTGPMGTSSLAWRPPNNCVVLRTFV